jgi:hypothetical protein
VHLLSKKKRYKLIAKTDAGTMTEFVETYQGLGRAIEYSGLRNITKAEVFSAEANAWVEFTTLSIKLAQMTAKMRQATKNAGLLMAYFLK